MCIEATVNTWVQPAAVIHASKYEEEIMKKRFMKKALAAVLSAAMAFSMSPAAGTQTASAAPKFVRLNTTFKTLKTGQKDYKLRLVNNTMNWKITKVTTSNKKVATVYGKTASYVLLKGKSEGRAAVKVSLKTKERKKNNTKTLKCTVKVVPASTAPAPAPAPAPVQTSAEVATQAQLTAAMADTSLLSITIRTDNAESFTIPAADRRNVELTVNAPNAEVTNSAVFKSIHIMAVKDSTWTEKASGNAIRLNALKARLVVDEGASVPEITVAKENADVKIVINGTAARVLVNAKAKVALSGNSKTKVSVSIAASAADSEVTAGIPAEIETAASAVISLTDKAAGSTVKITSPAAAVTIKNSVSGYSVPVTKADGKVQNVAKEAVIKPASQTAQQPGSISGGYWGGGYTGGGSGGSSYNPSTKSWTAKDTDTLAKLLADAKKLSSDVEITIQNAEGDANTGKNKIVIDEGDYDNVTLVVNASKKTIENHAKFKAVNIQDISPDTWHEFSKKSNTLDVSAKNSHIEVAADAVVGSVNFQGASEITKTVLKILGKIGNIRFNAPVKDASVDVQKTASVENVSIGSRAKDSDVKMEVTGQITESVACDADAKLAVIVKQEGTRIGSVKKVTASQDMYVALKADTGVSISSNIIVELNGDAKLASEVPVTVTAKKETVSVSLSSTALKSSVTCAAGVKEVTVNTKVDITVTVSGKEVSVSKDTTGTVSADGVVKVNMSKSELSLKKGRSETLSITGVDFSGSVVGAADFNVKWESSSEDVTVDQNGKVTAVNEGGEAQITATVTINNGVHKGEVYKGLCIVKVEGSPVVTVSLPEGRTSLTAGEGAVELTVSVKSSEGKTIEKFTTQEPESSPAAVAAAAKSGEKGVSVTPLKEGTAVITVPVKVDGDESVYEGKLSITVEKKTETATEPTKGDAVVTVSLPEGTTEIKAEDSLVTLTVSVASKAGQAISDFTISAVEVTDTSVADVEAGTDNKTLKVTPKKAGSTEVKFKVTYGDKYVVKTHTITVLPVVALECKAAPTVTSQSGFYVVTVSKGALEFKKDGTVVTNANMILSSTSGNADNFVISNISGNKCDIEITVKISETESYTFTGTITIDGTDGSYTADKPTFTKKDTTSGGASS